MRSLISFATIELEFLVFGYSSVIFYQLLTGRINTRGLLFGRSATGQSGFSPARLQVLLLTLGTAFYVLSGTISAGTPRLPDIDARMLEILGGTHAIFLGSKGYSLFRALAGDNN